METSNDSGTMIPASQRPDGTWRKARRVKDGYVPQEEVPLYESKGKQMAKKMPTHPLGLHPEDIVKHKQRETSNSIPGLPMEIIVTKATSKKTKNKKEKSKEPESAGFEITFDPSFMNKEDKVEKPKGKTLPTLKKETKTKKKTENNPKADTDSNKKKPETKTEKVAGKKSAKAPEAKKTNKSDAKKTEKDPVKSKTEGKKADETTEAEGDEVKERRMKTLKKKVKEIVKLETRIESKDIELPSKDQLEKISKKESFLNEIDELEKLLKNIQT